MSRYRRNTLCWSCAKAVGNSNCPWANELKPVKGWEAEERTIRDQIPYTSDWYYTTSYEVKKCPLYKWDGREDE